MHRPVSGIVLQEAVHLITEEPGLAVAAEADQSAPVALAQKGACRIVGKIDYNCLQAGMQSA